MEHETNERVRLNKYIVETDFCLHDSDSFLSIAVILVNEIEINNLMNDANLLSVCDKRIKKLIPSVKKWLNNILSTYQK